MLSLTFDDLLQKAKALSVVKTAIVHPVTVEALEGAIEAYKAKLIEPILVGPLHKIELAAEKIKADISLFEIISTEHSHAAAEQAVMLARAGKVEMLMKGSLHTDEFMHAVVNKEKGLRTARRMSHVFIAEVPTYQKLLLITDCALNIWPELMEKKDIVQNAIDLAESMDISMPKVAILSAIEVINDKLTSTIDAAALCKMADRGQIVNGVLDGPLAFDNAISKEAAEIKNINSAVAGKADILVAPDLEAGNMLAKQLLYLANAKLAGIVVGARVPIALTSRADNAEARLISCALGLLYKQYLNLKK